MITLDSMTENVMLLTSEYMKKTKYINQFFVVRLPYCTLTQIACSMTLQTVANSNKVTSNVNFSADFVQ